MSDPPTAPPREAGSRLDGVADEAVDADLTPVDPIDDPLMAQVRHIEALPQSEHVAAFETLNRSLVAALGDLEQL